MKRLVIWGAYPSTLKAVRKGETHIAGLGDGLLWWLLQLVKQLREQGHVVEWGDLVETASLSQDDGETVLLLLDLPHPGCTVTQRLWTLIPQSRRVLMRLEPPAIAPKAYQQRTLQQFNALARVEPCEDDKTVQHVLDFIVPLETELPVLQAQAQRKGLCAVSSHKRIVGPRGQLYALRERVYRQLAAAPVDFTLYGGGWNRFVSGIDQVDWLLRKLGLPLDALAPQGLNYQGPIPDKSDITRHNYTVVIENHIGQTYLSEKPFDSLKYGIVPIYYGGVDLRALGLNDLVLQAHRPEDIVAIASSLPSPMPQAEVQRRYAAWLMSPAARRFSLDHCKHELVRLFNRVTANE